MAHRTKKVKAAGRFGAGYGTPRNRLTKIEEIQRKKQTCPFCKKKHAKRKENGIWQCTKCKKVFAGGTYTP